MKISELRDVARSQGWKGWSRLRKSDLILFISERERREAAKREFQKNLPTSTLKPTPYIPPTKGRMTTMVTTTK